MRARAAPVKLSGQLPTDWIGHAHELLQRFHRSRLDGSVGGKIAVRQKAPVGEKEIELDFAVYAATLYAAASQGQLLGRIGQVSFDGIHGPVFVADVFAAKVPDEQGPSRGADDAALPFGVAGDNLYCVGRVWSGVADRVDEIAIAFQRSRVEAHIERGLVGSERSGDGAACFRCFKIAGQDVERLRIVAVANFPVAIDRNVAWSHFIGRIPLHFCSDHEVLEAGGPGFDGVGGNQRVPVQLIGGKPGMLDIGKHAGEVRAFHVRVCAEQQAIET